MPPNPRLEPPADRRSSARTVLAAMGALSIASALAAVVAGPSGRGRARAEAQAASAAALDAAAHGGPPARISPAREAARFARFALVLIGILGLAAILWRISGLIVLAFGGVLLAIALRAAARPIQERMGLSSGWAFATAILLILCALALLVWLIGSQLAAEVSQLRQQLPQSWSDMRSALEQSQLGSAALDAVQGAASGASAAQAAGLLATTFGALADAFLIAVLAIFLGANPSLYRRGFLCLVPRRHDDRVARAIDATGEGLRKWLLGQGLAMLLVGTLTGVGLWIIGVPMPLTLGLLAALLNFVPFLGPIAAAVPAVLVAFSAGTSAVLYTLALYFVVQQLEGNVFQPLIQKWAVSLPPALTILAVAMFGMLFGIVGVIFATPMMVALMILVRHLYVRDTLGRA